MTSTNSAKEELSNFKNTLDKELKKYLELKIKESKKLSPLTKKLTEYIADLTLRGGKRVRAALLYYSYLAHGGKNRKEALLAAMSMELSESFLLIHDDIMDDDKLRRGGETIHESYEELSKVKYRETNDNHHHFGVSMGLLAGDIAAAMSNEILTERNFDCSYIIRAVKELNKIYVVECYGQALDVYSEILETVTKDDVILTHQLKTVPYTFDGPVKLGAILAGKSEKEIKKLEGYTVPLGTAFQIQDDILGLFGSEEKIGKPVTSDLKEGKKTLLILDALEKADEYQKDIIYQNLGNKKATIKGLKEVRKVVLETGSLDESKKIAQNLVNSSIKSIRALKLEDEGKDFLINLADYVIKREY